MERVRDRRRDEDTLSVEGEEETVGLNGLLHNLSIERVGTEEEAVEQLEVVLEM